MTEKVVKILLQDGNLNGIIKMECTSWNSGILFSAPRDSVSKLVSETTGMYGIYLLLSSDKVYVGQSSDLSKRIKQHTSGKDWWDKAVILTTTNNSFNKSDIDYLESNFIIRAAKNKRLHCDNKKEGNPSKVDSFNQVGLEQYISEALMLIKLLGINMFDETSKSCSLKPKVKVKPVENTKTLNKSDAIALLKKNGFQATNNDSFASAQNKNPRYHWCNPRTEVVQHDWNLILNDQYERKITYITIPANTFIIRSTNEEGFICRTDKPYYIDLKINTDTLIDMVSGYDFSPYIVSILNY